MKSWTQILRSALALLLVCMMVVSCSHVTPQETDTEETKIEETTEKTETPTQTEEKTDAETEATTQGESEKVTESEKATVSETEKVTESETEKVTESEKATESETEKVTESEKATESETEKATESEEATEFESEPGYIVVPGIPNLPGFPDLPGIPDIPLFPEDTEHIHAWNETVVLATCSAQGYTQRNCACGASEKVNFTKIDDNAHSWGELVATERATCLENGYSVKICKLCEIEDKIPEQALGHDWKDATCTEAQICNRCDATGSPAVGHVFAEVPSITHPATCTKAGDATYECENCDEIKTIQAEPAKGHKNVTWSGEVVMLAVDGKSCTFINTESGTCNDCGASVSRSSAEYVKHTELASITVAPTCSAVGTKTYNCSVCEAENLRTEEIAISATAHKWNEGVALFSGSSTVYTCELCESTKVTYTEGSATLDVGNIDAVELKGAVITPDETTKDSLGGKDVTLSVDVKTADQLDLDTTTAERLGNGKVYDLSMTEGDNQITNFSGEITVRIPYTLEEGEDPENIVVWYLADDGTVEEILATYEEGCAVFTVEHFSYYTVTRMTPAERCALYGHHEKVTDVPATCVSGGYELHLCLRCGQKSFENEVDALGHEWNVTTTEATCDKVGSVYHECDRCATSYEEILAATGHEWHPEEKPFGGHDGNEEHLKAPTCTEKGQHRVVCEKCDAYYEEAIPQLGHEYQSEVTEATCEEGGYTRYTCVTCEATYDGDYTKAHGHRFDKAGHCEICGEDCEHEYVDGECKHCHAVKDVVYPTVTEIKTYVASVSEMSIDLVKIHKDADGNVVKIVFEILRLNRLLEYDDQDYVFNGIGNIYEFYLVDDTASIFSYSCGEHCTGYEIWGEAKYSFYEGKIWATLSEDEEEVLSCTIDNACVDLVGTEKTVYHYYHTDDDHVYLRHQKGNRIEENSETVTEGSLTTTTKTFVYYCLTCGALADKYVESETVDANGNVVRTTDKRYVLVNGEDKLVVDAEIRYETAQSTVVEGESYNYPVYIKELSYLLNGEAYEGGEMTFVYDGDNRCNPTVEVTYFDGSTESGEYGTEHFYSEPTRALAEGAENCLDGVVESSICLSCGETRTYTYEDHIMDVEVAVLDLTEYGGEHCGKLVIYTCLCENSTCAELVDNNCSFTETVEFYSERVQIAENAYRVVQHTVTYYTCQECGFVYSTDEASYYANCRRYNRVDYRIGEEGLTVETAVDLFEEHVNKVTEYIEDECDRSVVDGKLVVTESYIRSCKACGMTLNKNKSVRTFDDEKGTNVLVEDVYSYAPVGDEFVLGTLNHFEYACAQGKYKPDYTYSYEVLTRYEYYDENGEVANWIQQEYTYDEENPCNYTIKYTDSDGESREDFIEGEHTATFNKLVLRNPDGNCLDGIDMVAICANCGEILWRDPYSDGEHMYDWWNETECPLTEYGHTCESYIRVASCPCGEQTTVDAVVYNCAQQSTRKNIDGVTHTITTYICQDGCDAVLVSDKWNIIDESCNAVRHTVFTFEDGTTKSFEVMNGKQHDIRGKQLPDESSDVTDDEGIRTVTNAVEQYCDRCLATLSKYKTIEVYNADEELTERTHCNYSYKAISETEGTWVMSNQSTEKYESAACSYDPTTRRAYVVERVDVYYDEDGNEISTTRFEYTYEGEGHCIVNVREIADNGEVYEYQNISHAEYKYVWKLAEGSESCLDGIERYRICGDCGEEEDYHWSQSWHQSSGIASQRVDLSEYGSVCGSELVIYKCPCGEMTFVEFEGACEYTFQDETWDKYTSGWTRTYGCAVTHPETCGFTYTEKFWATFSESNCMQLDNYKYTFGTGDNVFTLTFANPTTSYSHIDVDTITKSETGFVKESSCSRCGMKTSSMTVENGEYTSVKYHYGANGELTGKYTETGIARFEGDAYQTYGFVPYNVHEEQYEKDGSVWWCNREYTYEGAAEGNFCVAKVIYTDSDGSTHEEEETRHTIYHSNDAPCVPGSNTLSYACTWCDYKRYSDASYSRHNFKHDENLGLYVCTKCGLESVTGVNGEVVLADMTLAEGKGALNYVVGFSNDGKFDEYIWSVALVVEGVEDFIILDVKTTESKYRLTVDAAEVAAAAKELGYEACEYMVRVAVVPVNGKESLEYAITLDPHVLTLNAEQSTADVGACEGSGVLVYDCLLCNAEAVVSKEYTAEHDYVYERHEQTVFNKDGTQLWKSSSNYDCSKCDSSYGYSEEVLFAANGEVLSRVSENVYENGDIDTSKSEYTYDDKNGTYTETITSSDSENVSVDTYKLLENGEYWRIVHVSKAADGTVYYQYTYDYEIRYDNAFQILERYESGDYWEQTEYEYAYNDKINYFDTVTETRTRKDGTVDWIRTRKVFNVKWGYSSRVILCVYPNAMGTSIAREETEYLMYEDNVHIASRRTDYADESWRLVEYEYDFEAGTYVQTTTRSDGSTTTQEGTIK